MLHFIFSLVLYVVLFFIMVGLDDNRKVVNISFFISLAWGVISVIRLLFTDVVKSVFFTVLLIIFHIIVVIILKIISSPDDNDKTEKTISSQADTNNSIKTTATSPVKQYKPEPISNVSINSFPEKKIYSVGENFDSKGLTLLVTHNNGKSDVVSMGFTVNGFDPYNTGKQNVQISYRGFSTYLSVEVTNRIVEENKIEPVLTPSQQAFAQPKQTVPLQFSQSSQNNNVSSDKKIFSFVGIYDYPKTEYEIGDFFDEDGLKLKVEYTDGSSEIIDSFDYDFNITGFDSEKPGQQIVFVSYEGYKLPITVFVKAPEKISVEDIQTPVGNLSCIQKDNGNYDIVIHSNLTGKDHKYVYTNGQTTFKY